MDKVINLGIPHVGELIFESIDTPELFQFALISETWKVLAENVLIKRWKGKLFQACQNGETKIVQLLLEHCNSEENGLNIKEFKVSKVCKDNQNLKLFPIRSKIQVRTFKRT